MRVEVVPAGPDQAASVAPRLAEFNRVAILGLGYMSTEEALRFSLQHSPDAWAILLDGRPEVLGGFAQFGGEPQAWLATTDEAYRVRFTMHREVKRALARHVGETVQAVVHAIDREARAWLEALGFEEQDLVFSAANGAPFYVAQRRA
ncbi:MAG TPA: hypothetical protein VLS93_13435 [Anaeromyxobacteraceae bacterium]|nr:hypothetical protein [Anaeromyxobacteraceae bacterium]